MQNLLLIPTQAEFVVLQPLLEDVARRRDWSIELCGFGPIAAAARTSQLLAAQATRRVLLIGIAGTYDKQQPLATANEFEHVSCYGIGAGTGHEHQSANDLGWTQWPGSAGSATIGDRIPLDAPQQNARSRPAHLLTCCSAASTSKDVQCRLQAHPEATAEDMEGFGVALACQLAGVPLRIARGISNLAGDRDKNHWNFEAALQAVANLAESIISNGSFADQPTPD